jgi:hypothetical protein
MAKKIFNTIRTAILCGYTYWKNPENFTNEGFAFTGQIMDTINKTANEKLNFINQVATVHKDTGKEIVKMSIWIGVYDCETAQDNPFDRITRLLSKRDEVLNVYLKKEKELDEIFKPLFEKQEYAKAKEMGCNDLNLIRRFITHLKSIK